MNLRQAAEMALSALETARCYVYQVNALRAALAEADEPVAWAYVNSDGECEEIEYGRYSEADDSCITHLYTHPPRREPLPEDEIIDILQRLHERSGGLHNYYLHAIKVIKERAHGIGGDE